MQQIQMSNMLTVNPGGFPGGGGALTLDSASINSGVSTLERLLDTYSRPGVPSGRLTTDSAASGQTFLTGELEKPDFKLYEPLTSVTWPRDIVVKTGGGPVDYVSNMFVDYATSGANQYGLMGANTTALPTIQGNTSKELWPVNTFGYIVRVPFLDQQRMLHAGRSLEQVLQNGLRLNYDKTLDQTVYFGMSILGQTGLLNNPNVTQTVAALNSGGTSRKWRDKTPVEILDDVNTAINDAYARAEYDITGMPNQINLPPSDFNYINGTLISSAGSQSILSFLLQNNTAKAQGVDLKIVSCRQCIAAGEEVVSGTGSSGRMFVYVNNVDRVHFEETQPLYKVFTQPSVEQLAYLTAYMARVSQVKFLYTQCAGYVDGIS